MLVVSGIGTIHLDPIRRLDHILHVHQQFISLVPVHSVACIPKTIIKLNLMEMMLFCVISVEDWTC